MNLKYKLKDMDVTTLKIIEEKYGMLNVLDAFAGYAQMCNRELVAMKNAMNLHLMIDVHPLSKDQKRTLRNGGDMLTDIRKIISNGKHLKDKEVLNADFKQEEKHVG